MPSDADYLAAVQAGDTAQAQRMVDEAAKASGYTAIGYHSTTSPEFAVFDMSMAGKSTGGWLPIRGMFFSNDPSYSSHLTDDASGVRVGRYLLQLSRPLNAKNADHLEKVLGGDFDQRPDEGLKRLNELGYDSVILAGGDEIIVTSPSQIKSADPITRDDSGNIIPLSQRFQSTSPDIRYMPAPVPDPSIPGAYSMSGYRILPGKTKGKFRVYSPDGSLAGVVGSVDDAQRMIEKKLK